MLCPCAGPVVILGVAIDLELSLLTRSGGVNPWRERRGAPPADCPLLSHVPVSRVRAIQVPTFLVSPMPRCFSAPFESGCVGPHEGCHAARSLALNLRR